MKWIHNPYDEAYLTNIPDSVDDAEAFIDITSSALLKSAFQERTLATFWFGVKQEYPALATQELKYLMPFQSTYLCESTFSDLLTIKTKKRNKLDVENDLRLKVTNISPNIDSLVANKQQPSH